jgi:hypothetical protein
MVGNYRIMAEINVPLVGEYLERKGFSRTRHNERNRLMTDGGSDSIPIPQLAYSHPDLSCKVITALPMGPQLREYREGFEGRNLILKPKSLIVTDVLGSPAQDANSAVLSLDLLERQAKLARELMVEAAKDFMNVGKAHLYEIVKEGGLLKFNTLVEP